MYLSPFFLICWMVLVCGCASAPRETPGQVAQDGAQHGAQEGGDVVAGQGIYEAQCAACHRLGEYDTQGSVNLARHARHVKPDFLAGHFGVSVTAEEAAQLRAFILRQ